MTSNESKHPLVSIIVPIFNVESYLGACLTSIKEQEYPALEVILIDDGSTDSSLDVARQFVLDDARFKLIQQQNSGVSHARNTGLDAATGAWVAFVDADDWIAPGFIQLMVEYGQRSEAQMVVSTQVLKRETAEVRLCAERALSPQSATERLLYPEIPVGCWNKLYSREFVNTHSLRFSERFEMGEGLVFITNASQRSKVTIFTDLAGYYYRRDNSSSVTSTLTTRRMRNALSAIDNIERNLILNSPSVDLALMYHRWRTFFLSLAVELRGASSSTSPHATDAIRFLRRYACRMIFRTRLTGRERLKTIAIALAPKLAAKCLGARWSANGTK